MPDKISDQRLERVIDWLKERTEATCPFCGSQSWTVDDELSSMPTYQEGDSEVQTARGHTLILVTCEACGFTAPFAAKKVASV